MHQGGPIVGKMSQLGDRMRSAREAVGLTRDQAAKEIGVATGTLALWERGRSRPARVHSTFAKMAALYDVAGMELVEAWAQDRGIDLDDG